MHVGVERRDNCTILHLRGEFDSFYCRPLLEKIDSLIDLGMRHAVLNLRFVKFISSTALGTMIKAAKMMSAKNGKLVISCPTAFCRNVMVTVGVDRLVSMFDSDDAAIKHLLVDVPAPMADGVDLVDDEDAGILFHPVDESVTAKFIPTPKDKQPRDPVHGHAFGSSWRGIGRMLALDSDGMRFSWDGGQTHMKPSQMAEMLAPGTDLRVKFRLPLLQRQLSEAVVTVTEVKERADELKVAAKFSEIQSETLKAVQQYEDDLNYLRDELRKVDDGRKKG